MYYVGHLMPVIGTIIITVLSKKLELCKQLPLMQVLSIPLRLCLVGKAYGIITI